MVIRSAKFGMHVKVIHRTIMTETIESNVSKKDYSLILRRYAISPIIPRLNARTQTTKIAPVVIVLHPPKLAK